MTSEPSGPPGAVPAAQTVELREGTVADAEAIEAVHYASREAVYLGRVSDWPPAGPDRAGRVRLWRAWLADPEIDCVVADDGGEIVGFCTVRPSADEDAGAEVAEMPTLYVSPGSWRRGLGTRLCAEAIRRAAAQGFRELTLWVLDVNRDAQRFYESYGFRADGVTKVDEGTRERLVAHRYRISLPAAS